VFDCLPLGTIIILHLDKLVLILEKVDVLAQWATVMEYFLDGDCIIPFCHVLGAFFCGISRDGDVNRGRSWKHPPW
jgi:hypothetical protein